MESGLISHIQKYSLQDGPGIRTTVFLKGCPLRCAWCHNPENVSPEPQILVFDARCVRCGNCARVCPQRQLPEGDSIEHWDAGATNARPANGGVGQCLVCGVCVEACPTGARILVGRRMAIAELLDEILSDRIFYDDSGGGVTFSGGEPLSQFAFLKAGLEACRDRGVHTTVDTCGFAPREHLLAVAPLTDLFLYDLKAMSDERHREFTGVSNRLILENLRALAREHHHIWIRVPVVPGVNDNPSELDAMARLVVSLSGVRQVNLLPYHRTALHKFERLGQPYRLPGITPPSREYMEAVAARFANRGLEVKAGG